MSAISHISRVCLVYHIVKVVSGTGPRIQWSLSILTDDKIVPALKDFTDG